MDALEDNLLVPFQYFGIADGTDLRHINIRGGRYDETTWQNGTPTMKMLNAACASS